MLQKHLSSCGSRNCSWQRLHSHHAGRASSSHHLHRSTPCAAVATQRRSRPTPPVYSRDVLEASELPPWQDNSSTISSSSGTSSSRSDSRSSSRGRTPPRAWSKWHAEVLQAIRDRNLPLQKTRVLVAVSGGQDSLALAQLLVDMRHLLQVELVVAHCDHAIREDSSANAAWVQRLAAGRWGVPCHVVTAQQDLRKEADARTWRYKELYRLAAQEGCTAVVTGHTATDRAETVLFNLVRGCGTDGLRSLPWQRPLGPDVRLVRPLLELPRAATALVCQHRDLQVWEDGTNSDLRYTRNFLRLQVLPQLEQVNRLVALHMSRVVDLVDDEVSFLESASRRLLNALVTADWGLEKLLLTEEEQQRASLQRLQRLRGHLQHMMWSRVREVPALGRRPAVDFDTWQEVVLPPLMMLRVQRSHLAAALKGEEEDEGHVLMGGRGLLAVSIEQHAWPNEAAVRQQYDSWTAAVEGTQQGIGMQQQRAQLRRQQQQKRMKELEYEEWRHRTLQGVLRGVGENLQQHEEESQAKLQALRQVCQGRMTRQQKQEEQQLLQRLGDVRVRMQRHAHEVERLQEKQQQLKHKRQRLEQQQVECDRELEEQEQQQQRATADKAQHMRRKQQRCRQQQQQEQVHEKLLALLREVEQHKLELDQHLHGLRAIRMQLQQRARQQQQQQQQQHLQNQQHLREIHGLLQQHAREQEEEQQQQVEDGQHLQQLRDLQRLLQQHAQHEEQPQQRRQQQQQQQHSSHQEVSQESYGMARPGLLVVGSAQLDSDSSSRATSSIPGVREGGRRTVSAIDTGHQEQQSPQGQQVRRKPKPRRRRRARDKHAEMLSELLEFLTTRGLPGMGLHMLAAEAPAKPSLALLCGCQECQGRGPRSAFEDAVADSSSASPLVGAAAALGCLDRALVSLPVKQLQAVPPGLLRRVVRLWLSDTIGVSACYKQVAEVLRLLSPRVEGGTATSPLADGIVVRKRKGQLVLEAL